MWLTGVGHIFDMTKINLILVLSINWLIFGYHYPRSLVFLSCVITNVGLIIATAKPRGKEHRQQRGGNDSDNAEYLSCPNSDVTPSPRPYGDPIYMETQDTAKSPWILLDRSENAEGRSGDGDDGRGPTATVLNMLKINAEVRRPHFDLVHNAVGLPWDRYGRRRVVVGTRRTPYSRSKDAVQSRGEMDYWSWECCDFITFLPRLWHPYCVATAIVFWILTDVYW